MQNQLGFARTAASVGAHFRPDIQGLRAVAVLAVVAEHVRGWPTGGFVGVDVFFVISGFLITGLLLREFERAGRISFTAFYRRRLRRLAPASLLTIAATTVVAYLVFTTTRFHGVLVDAVWSTLFVGNWRFATAGVDYFAASSSPSPLQHFWSLGVEEQFYLVWPWLLLAALALGIRRTPSRPRRIAALTIGAVVLVSFAWAVVQTHDAPAFAYFSTWTRVWELGVGALVALAPTQIRAAKPIVRHIAAYVGLAAILFSILILDDEFAFPGPWAALPVLGAVLVVGSSPPSGPWILTNPVARYVGDISYSVYLWHFPVIIFVTALLPLTGGRLSVVILGITAILSITSYHLVERPMNASPLFGSFIRADWAPAWRIWGRRWRRSYAIGLPAAVVALATALATIALVPPNATATAEAPEVFGTSVSSADRSGTTASLQSEIAKALTASTWPTLDPEIDVVGDAINDEMRSGSGCLNPHDVGDLSLCTYGEGSRRAVVVGDSFAVAWLPAIRGALEPLDFVVRGIGFSTCPFSTLRMDLDLGVEFSDRCNDTRQDLFALIRAIDPELVIVIDSEYTVSQVDTDFETTDEFDKAWIAGRLEALQAIAGRRIVILAPNPAGKSIPDCAVTNGSPQMCESPVDGAWYQRNRLDNTVAQMAGIEYYNTLEWFCSKGVCPSFVGHDPVRWDIGHLTPGYASRLSAPIRAVLAVPTD